MIKCFFALFLIDTTFQQVSCAEKFGMDQGEVRPWTIQKNFDDLKNIYSRSSLLTKNNKNFPNAKDKEDLVTKYLTITKPFYGENPNVNAKDFSDLYKAFTSFRESVHQSNKIEERKYKEFEEILSFASQNRKNLSEKVKGNKEIKTSASSISDKEKKALKILLYRKSAHEILDGIRKEESFKEGELQDMLHVMRIGFFECLLAKLFRQLKEKKPDLFSDLNLSLQSIGTLGSLDGSAANLFIKDDFQEENPEEEKPAETFLPPEQEVKLEKTTSQPVEKQPEIIPVDFLPKQQNEAIETNNKILTVKPEERDIGDIFDDIPEESFGNLDTKEEKENFLDHKSPFKISPTKSPHKEGGNAGKELDSSSVLKEFNLEELDNKEEPEDSNEGNVHRQLFEESLTPNKLTNIEMTESPSKTVSKKKETNTEFNAPKLETGIFGCCGGGDRDMQAEADFSEPNSPTIGKDKNLDEKGLLALEKIGQYQEVSLSIKKETTLPGENGGTNSKDPVQKMQEKQINRGKRQTKIANTSLENSKKSDTCCNTF